MGVFQHIYVTLMQITSRGHMSTNEGFLSSLGHNKLNAIGIRQIPSQTREQWAFEDPHGPNPNFRDPNSKHDHAHFCGFFALLWIGGLPQSTSLKHSQVLSCVFSVSGRWKRAKYISYHMVEGRLTKVGRQRTFVDFPAHFCGFCAFLWIPLP